MSDAKVLDLNDRLQRGAMAPDPSQGQRLMVGYGGTGVPHSPECERSVLAATLAGDGTGIAIVMNTLEPQAFFVAAHQRIATAARDLLSRGLVADRLTVGALVTPEIVALVPEMASDRDVEAHGRVVFELAQVRDLGKLAMTIADHCKGRIGDARAVLDRALTSVAKIVDRDPCDSTIAPFGDDIVPYFTELQARSQAPQERPRGLSTGFPTLDRMTQGFADGQLWVVGAPTGGGKTSLALNMLASAALESDGRPARPALIFSMEMKKQELMERLVASEARFDLRDIAKATPETWARITHAASWLKQVPILRDCSAGIDIRDLKSRARRVADERRRAGHPLGLIVVDYLQLVTAPEVRGQTREERVGKIVRDLKNLASELNCTVLATSQLRREVDREKRRPRRSDLRESGDIENAADVILLLWGDSAGSDATRIVIDKQRAGPTGLVPCRFTKAWTRFDEMEAYEASQWSDP